MKNRGIRKIAVAAVIAACYAGATIALAPISYGFLQFRVAEALCVLPFLYPPAIWSLGVGCLISNLLSPYGLLDIAAGTLATLLAAFWTSRMHRKAFAPLPPIICNGIIIGAVIAISGTGGQAFAAAFTLYGIQVALGEAVVMYALGLPLLLALSRNRLFERITGNDISAV